MATTPTSRSKSAAAARRVTRWVLLGLSAVEALLIGLTLLAKLG
jgi:hypothetical protein